MATAAVIGLRSSIHYSNYLSEMVNYSADLPLHHQLVPSKKMITAKKSFVFSPNFSSSDNRDQSVNALKEELINSTHVPSSIIEENPDPDVSLEALLLLQKSLLEKQWNLSAENTNNSTPVRKKPCRKIKQQQVTTTCSSGTSARRRRMENRQQIRNSRNCNFGHLKSIGNSDQLIHNRFKSYIKGVGNEELLTHKEVVHLSIKIKECVWLEDHKARLKQRLGSEPSEEQLADSLNISRADLQSKQLEYCLAREKLAMSNIRLVMSIAQRYDNMGVEMPDLIQGGLIGLLRGIEKFDSSKGFKISTYVYWWIRQGVTRAFVDNSRTLRLPLHLHERLRLIRNAKIRLKEKGIINPSVDRIAESLNMSQKKVRNATEVYLRGAVRGGILAMSKVFSLDREAFPSINGLPGETLHSYIADDREENDTWNITEEWVLKEEVNKLINSTLTEREREIIRLYYGLDNECLTWEDISKRIGLSRERVRQVGLVAIEKLKHSARRSNMEAMLVKH